MLNFIEWFFCICLLRLACVSFNMLIWLIILIDFSNVEPTLHFWNTQVGHWGECKQSMALLLSWGDKCRYLKRLKQLEFAEQSSREEDPMQRKKSRNLETITECYICVVWGSVRLVKGQLDKGKLNNSKSSHRPEKYSSSEQLDKRVIIEYIWHS